MRTIQRIDVLRDWRIIRTMTKRQARYAVKRLLHLLDARDRLIEGENKSSLLVYEDMARMLAEAITPPYTHPRRTDRGEWHPPMVRS